MGATGHAWLACVGTGERWLYLAAVIDLATHVVVGWHLAAHMRASLVTDALDVAIGGGHTSPACRDTRRVGYECCD